MQYIFSSVLNNKVLSKQIFVHVNKINKEESGDSFKWSHVKNNLSSLVKYNYINEYKEYLKRYIANRVKDKDYYSYIYYESIRLSISFGRLDFIKSLVYEFNIVFNQHIKPSIMMREAALSGRLDIIIFLDSLYGKEMKPCEFIDAFHLSPFNSVDHQIINWFYNKVITLIKNNNSNSNNSSIYYRYEDDEDHNNNKKIISILKVYESTSIKGNISIIKWLRENQLYIDNYETIIQIALENGNIDYLNWIKDNIKDVDWDIAIDLDKLSLNLQLDSIKWSKHHFRNFICTKNAMDNAIRENNLELIKWFHENRTEGCSDSIMDHYSFAIDLDTIEWIHQNMTLQYTTLAMDNSCGSIEKLKWFHKNRSEGCTSRAMDNASIKGNMELVKFLHSNRTEGCTTNAMDNAVRTNNFELVKWFHENRTEGCTHKAIDNASTNNNTELVHWLLENRTEGCSEIGVIESIIHSNFEIFNILMKYIIKRQHFLNNNNNDSNNNNSNNNNNDNQNNTPTTQSEMIQYFFEICLSKSYKNVEQYFLSRSLDMAAEKGCIYIFECYAKFLPNDPYNSDYRLFIATLYNHLHVIKHFYSKEKYKIFSSSSFYIAMDYDYPEIADYFIEHGPSLKDLRLGDVDIEQGTRYAQKLLYKENHQHFWS